MVSEGSYEIIGFIRLTTGISTTPSVVSMNLRQDKSSPGPLSISDVDVRIICIHIYVDA